MSTTPIFDQQAKASLALMDQENALVAPTPMAILHMAVARGAPIETIERLAKLQKEMREDEAKVAFNDAMQRAQARMLPVSADATNPQTKSRYATYAKLDTALRPIYTSEGFALSFDEGDSPGPDIVRVLCYVSHKAGYTRTYKKDMPADGKGAKGGDVMTKTHASGAADSYGMRYLLKKIFNVAIGEEDIDGNGALGKKEMSPEDFTFWDSKISEAINMDDLNAQYQAACDAAGRDQGAKDSFKKTANKKWRIFGGGK